MASAESKQLIFISNFPNDLVVHKIFPRLPAKSLARFKCVSKLWLKTISDPDLAKSHLLHQTPGRINIHQGSILHFTDPNDDDALFYRIDLFHLLSEPRLLPIKSCNGLLLVRRQPDSARVMHVHYVINPVIGRYVELPLVQPFTDCFMHFDSVLNQYKVLGWNANGYHNPVPLNVLILNDEGEVSWRALKVPKGLIMMWYPPVLFDGRYYWIVKQHKNEEWAMLAFDIESGTFRVMEVPDTTHMVPSDGWNYRLVTENESLYLIQHHCPSKLYCHVIWSLEDYEQQIWTEMYQYRVEYCQRCKESGWDNRSSVSNTLFDVKEIIKRGPQYYNNIVHTNSLVWLDRSL